MADDAVSLRMQRFASHLLAWSGALVDWPAGSESGLAILSPEDAAGLGVAEDARLSTQPIPDGLSANLATDFLERVAPLVARTPTVAAWRLREAYLKKASPEETVAKAFDWLNARVRVRSSRPQETEYHSWYFRAALISEDRWEDILPTTLNSASGAQIPLPELTGRTDGEWEKHPPAFQAGATFPHAAKLVWQMVLERAGAFLERMDERHRRDVKRLRNYYNALLRDKGRRRRHADDGDPFGGLARQAEAKAKEEEKKQIVQLELERKIREMDERYAVTGELEAVGCLRIFLPALAIDLAVQRKARTAERTVYWNPVLKAVEPMACSSCGAAIFSVAFTDDTVKPLCSACHAKPNHE